MNDLTSPERAHEVLSQIQSYFPNILEALRKAQTLFERVRSFEDVETYLLRGAGLSPNTYRCYLTAVKQLYEFTQGLNPLQVTSGHIERYYDEVSKRVDRNTAALRIRGLKRFFSGVAKLIPGYISPFEVMEEKLRKKLNRVKKGNRTKKALNIGEVKRLLAWLSEDRSVKGLSNYAVVFMLVTSGLRAAELCQLKWGDLELEEGTWTANFIGKGGKEASQELYEPAVMISQFAYRAQFHRDPELEDHLFWSLPAYAGDQVRPMTPHRLWVRITELGDRAKAEGIIKRDINFSPHMFRRTYATCLYRSGMKIKAIQEKTRHASIEVLVKHYIHDEEPAAPYFARMLEGVA
jgi:integrase/recombinase XerD